MTNWTLETLEDFDGVFFDSGMGWKVLFEIHLAISLRSRYFSVGGTNFDTQISGIVWTDDDSSDDNRDLKTELRYCYAAIVELVNGNDNFRWTEESGRSPEWTMASLVADIGMGEFADLLVRTQSPEPLVWLIEAINRLEHPKILRPLYTQEVMLFGESPSPLFNGDYRENLPGEVAVGGGGLSQEDAWDNVAYDPDVKLYTRPFPTGSMVFSVGCSTNRATFGGGIAALTRANCKILALASKTVDDEYYPSSGHVWTRPLRINCIDYPYTIVASGYTGGDLTVKIGSVPDTNVGRFSGTGVLESVGADLDFRGDTTVDFELLTPYPSTNPFLPLPLFSSGYQITVRLSPVWLYCDLPEIMGAGELTAPIPTVSGEAEQEE